MPNISIYSKTNDNSLSIDNNSTKDKSPSIDSNLTSNNSPSIDNNLTSDNSLSIDNNSTKDKSPSIDSNLTSNNSPSIDNNSTKDKSPSIDSNLTSNNSQSIDNKSTNYNNCLEQDGSKVVEKICRICYENETDNNDIIEPCRCGGSIRWVHKKCLLKWINMNPTRNSKCDICKFSYKITKICTIPILSSINKNYIRIPIIILFFSIIIISCIILFNIISGNEVLNISFNAFMYSFRCVTIISIIGIAFYLNYHNLDYNISSNFYSSNSVILLNFHLIRILDHIFDNEINKYLSYEYDIENI